MKFVPLPGRDNPEISPFMLKNILKNPLSLSVAVFSSILIIAFRFHDTINNVLSWDVFGYYIYLPAKFIYHDLGLNDLSWVNHIMDKYHNTSTFYQACLGPANHLVYRYHMGLAYFYSPFFFIANWLAPRLGYPADGFSMPYQFCQVIGGLIYIIIGIFMLRKLLHHFFTDKVVAFTLMAILLGTNYLGTAALSTLMPHTILFTLYALILWFTMKWHEEDRPGYLIILGMLIGFAILVRPSEGIAILIPLFWGIYDKASLIAKVKKIWYQVGPVILFVLLIVLVCLPQMVYWKKYTGKFIYYSYVNPGEGFDFFPPHTLKFLFSFRKGWFIYTPVMLIALYGFYLIHRKKSEIFWPLTLFFIINLYIVSSWSCWWYGECFSQRGVVQSYSLMAIPVAFAVDHWLKLKSIKRFFWIILLTVLIFLNLFQHWQYYFKYIISPTRMTAAYYFKTFGTTKFHAENTKLLLVDRDMPKEEFIWDSAKYSRKLLGGLDFEKPWVNTNIHPEDSVVHDGKFAFRLDTNCLYTPAIYVKYKDITTKEYAWIKVTFWVFPTFEPKDNPTKLVTLYTHKGGIYDYQAQDIDKLLPSVTQGKWNKVEFYSMSLQVRSKNDSLMVYLWHVGRKPVFADDLKVEAYEPK